MHNWGTVTFFKLYGISTAVHRLSLAAANGGYFLAVVHGLLIVVVSLVVEHGL